MRNDFSRLKSFAKLLLVVSVTVSAMTLMVGCGGGATISGKVSYKGKAVNGGSLTFSPISKSVNPGKPVSTSIQSDGTFSLTEAAPVGTLEVRYEPPITDYPEGHEPKPGEALPKTPYDGLTAKQASITVTSGANTVNIELVPASSKR